MVARGVQTDWLDPAHAFGRAGAFHRRGIVRRAANSLSELITGVLRDDAIARRSGFLQSVDPRFKVFGLIGLIVVVTLLHSTLALALAYFVCTILAVLSRVPARRFLGVWLFVPLFSAALMIPAVLNIVTPGRPVWTIAHFHGAFGPWKLPETLAVTDAGIAFAGRFVLRTAVCVSLAVLLTATTPTARLFRGLRALGVPQVFVMLLSMMQRYLEVLARAAHEIHLAKISRSIHNMAVRQEQAWVAAGMGSLFKRTCKMSHDVYLAMLSRGYTGEVHLMDEPRWRVSDWVFLGGMAVVAAGLLVVSYWL
ncbi:MAG: cobalt ECF transporter T component CbiQ [Gammaproteobacteria bacterium]|nr:cobalt ECF transporter T component CbiQ [Gammaproteobacteria bacterium]